MAKALIICRMKQSGSERGLPDVDDSGLSFVHCSSAGLLSSHMAFVVAGTGQQLTTISAHPRFVAGQQIVYNDDTGEYDWSSARGAIAPDAKTKINAYLVANGRHPLSDQDNMVTLIQRFNGDFDVRKYDVRDHTR